MLLCVLQNGEYVHSHGVIIKICLIVRHLVQQHMHKAVGTNLTNVLKHLLNCASVPVYDNGVNFTPGVIYQSC